MCGLFGGGRRLDGMFCVPMTVVVTSAVVNMDVFRSRITSLWPHKAWEAKCQREKQRIVTTKQPMMILTTMSSKDQLSNSKPMIRVREFDDKRSAKGAVPFPADVPMTDHSSLFFEAPAKIA